ncbi:hypothetical protein [Shewanella sp. ENK2]|uniref:hypothetical protein n=1 Tax=Shewanella sp. ENK2 TaxID=2775245 RepID=UPI003748714D
MKRYLLMFLLCINWSLIAEEKNQLSFDELMSEGFNNLLVKDFKQAETDYLEAINRYCPIVDKKCSMAYSMMRDINLYQGDAQGTLKYAVIVDSLYHEEEAASKANFHQICKSDYFEKYKTDFTVFCLNK